MKPLYNKEMLDLELFKARLEVFKEIYNGESLSTFGLPQLNYSWALENIMGFSKEEIKDVLSKQKKNKK